jgi:hypothetical protein
VQSLGLATVALLSPAPFMKKADAFILCRLNIASISFPSRGQGNYRNTWPHILDIKDIHRTCSDKLICEITFNIFQ